MYAYCALFFLPTDPVEFLTRFLAVLLEPAVDELHRLVDHLRLHALLRRNGLVPIDRRAVQDASQQVLGPRKERDVAELLAKEIAEFITEAGLETQCTPDIKKYEWKKTILNASLMPVCATTGTTMKEAMEGEETRFLCERILKECIQVAERLGYDFGDDFFKKGVSYLSNAGDHKPSTSMDLEAGNPIEYVFQPIIDYGKKTGIPTPYLDSLTKVMRTLEKKKREMKS